MDRHTPGLADTHQKLASLINNGQFNDARVLAVKITRKHPDDPGIWYTLAGIYARLGRINEVIDCCKRVTRLSPSHAGAHYNLAIGLEQTGHLSEATSSYRQCLKHEPGNTRALIKLGKLLGKQGNHEDALRFFAQVDAKQLATRLQYDYYTAYLAFYLEQPGRARALVGGYADYPVDRWREAFAAIAAQLDEIEGQATAVVDTEDRSQVQTDLAASEASLESRVESKRVTLDYQNLDTVHVNYYLMDIELLFSRNPFVQQYSGQFSHIRPNLTQTVELPADGTTHQFDLPEQLHSSNVLVEISGGGQIESEAYYSNSLSVQVTENYGQLRVTHSDTSRALPKVYVKVYARMNDGRVRFYKDGYTDLRGRFDYASLNTNELEVVERFSLLILSEEHGAAVREAAPPKR